MSGVEIRPLRYQDVPDLIRLAQVAFADEFLAQGLTSEGFVRQLRLMSRGRLLPFKLLAALSGMTWEVLVAVRAGRIVGCGMYSGRRQMVLSLLMVDPAHRREGIGQALLARRLQRIEARGFKLASVMALATNAASLGNLAKQQFEVVERTALYELPEPAPAPGAGASPLASRPVERGDLAAFARLEAEAWPPVLLEVRDSQHELYFRSRADRAFLRLASTRTWERVFLHQGQVVGFMVAEHNRQQSKGLIHPPVMRAEHAHLLPHMLQAARDWLGQGGAQSAQLMLLESGPALIAAVEAEGWERVLTWVELARRFDGQPLQRSKSSDVKSEI